ncbi:MAG: DMT family transporter [Armatimonadetes bacterium]|nr:DMT family transporter [Armatimonadota bacterium]
MNSASTTEQRNGRSKAAGFFYVICATICWSTSPVCIKFALRSVDYFSLGFVRFAIGALILFGIGKARGQNMQLRRQDILLTVMGAAGLGLNHTIFIVGVNYTTASASGIIVQLEIISLVILSYFILKDRIGPLKFIGMVAALAGVFLAAWNGGKADLMSSNYLLGNSLVALSAPIWAVYAISQKLLSDRGVATSISVAYMFAFSAIITLPTALIFHNIHGALSPTFWTSLFVFIAFATVASCAFMAKGFELLDASTAGVVTSFFPIITIINAWIFLGEQPTKSMWMGVVLVVIGIIILGITEAKNAPHPIERQ